MTVKVACILLLSLFSLPVLCRDYYEILGVPKDADNREIRRAFKKLALKLHPDKNKNDPEAHDKFVELNKVYETLKDGEKRNIYDMHGEEGLSDDFFDAGAHYHSWTYYFEDFGIYDDDPEIITLSRADFDRNVGGGHDKWFINYYSPACSHCHQLAPTWRAVAKELEGVIRIGAVNCDEDRALCREQRIHSFPSLVFYPGEIHYTGTRNKHTIMSFAFSKLSTSVIELRDGNFKHMVEDSDRCKGRPWFIMFCNKDGDCPSKETQLKLAAVMDKLVNVAIINCDSETKLCEKLGLISGRAYFEAGKVTAKAAERIFSLDYKEIVNEVFSFLSEAILLDKKTYQEMRSRLELNVGPVWLVHFLSGHESDNFELKKLPALLPRMKIGKINCNKEMVICKEVHVQTYPTIILFKLRGGYEVHHGRINAYDIANFARESASAMNIKILTPNEFPSVIEDGSPWFVDFFAPWCPPCMKLLPEFRKASKVIGDQVQFGTIDCTIHSSLCNNYNIESYPTTILFNETKPHEFHGQHKLENIVEFINDMMNPSVISLTEGIFYETVHKKPVNEIWVIDYFAPWCGPCQKLAPEWRKFAKMVADIPEVHVGQVDCVAERNLCKKQSVHSYPSIRLYPLGGKGTSQVSMHQGHRRSAESLRTWLFDFLPAVVQTLNDKTIEDQVLRDSSPWLVDFYAPWCAACQVFAPKFEAVAKKLEGRVKAGKVDCDAHSQLCDRAGVEAYPTLLFYKGTDSRSKKQRLKTTEVDNIKSSYILSFVNRMLGSGGEEASESFYHDEF